MGTDPPRPSAPVLRSRTRTLRRRRALAGLAATLSAALVWICLATIESSRPRTVETRPVVTTKETVAAGAPIDAHLEVVDWPVDLVPDGSLSDPDAKSGAHAIVPLPAGIPITESLVTTDPSERRDELAVRTDPHTPPLVEGDVIDVWATFDPDIAGSGAATRRVADAAIVISADDERTMISVEPDRTSSVVEAITLATITLVRSPR